MMEMHLLFSKREALLVIRLFFALKSLINYFIIMGKTAVLWKCFLKEGVVSVLSLISVAEQPFQTSSHSPARHCTSGSANTHMANTEGAYCSWGKRWEACHICSFHSSGRRECSRKKQEQTPCSATEVTNSSWAVLGLHSQQCHAEGSQTFPRPI